MDHGKLIGKGGGGSVFLVNGDDTLVVKRCDLTKSQQKLCFYNAVKVNEIIHKKSDGKFIVEFLDHKKQGEYGDIYMKRYDCDILALTESKRQSVKKSFLRKIFYKICIAVKTMHEAGVAHLDLKPENILFDKATKSPYICDFGRSYISERISGEFISGLRGTEEYSPPEVKRCDEQYDPFKADIYSLGMLMFVCVTKKFPEDSNSIFGGNSKDFPPKFVDLVQQMTAENPAQRPPITDVLQHSYFKSSVKKGSLFSRLSNW